MGLIIALIFIAVVFGLLRRDMFNKQSPYNDPTKVDDNWPYPTGDKP
jgi:hypothetical protein